MMYYKGYLKYIAAFRVCFWPSTEIRLNSLLLLPSNMHKSKTKSLKRALRHYFCSYVVRRQKESDYRAKMGHLLPSQLC